MRQVNLEKVFLFFIKTIPYLCVTMEYVVISVLIGFSIGALVAKMKLSGYKILRMLAGFYVTIARCTPSVILLFLVFYGLPAILKNHFNVDINGFSTMFFVCVTFSVFIGASSSEIIRSALEAIDKGQWEAGLSVGLTAGQTFVRIILPQMVQKSIPNIGNTVIFLVKEGALAYTIGLQDILGRGFYLSSMEYNAYAVDMYIALTLIYWPLTVLLEKIFARIEKRLTPGRKNSEIRRRKGYESGLSIHN